MWNIGLDLHKRETQVCLLDETGAIQLERRLPTTRAAFTALFSGRAPARLLREAGTESEWVAQHLEALGHEVVVADPNYAPMYSTRQRAGVDALVAEGVTPDIHLYTLSGDEFDMRARMFAPLDGVPEDPATGLAEPLGSIEEIAGAARAGEVWPEIGRQPRPLARG